MKSKYDQLYDEFVKVSLERDRLEKLVKVLKQQLYESYSKLKEEGKDLDVKEVFDIKKKPYKYQKRRR